MPLPTAPRLLLPLVLAAASAPLQAQTTPPAVATAIGTGVQIYTCADTGKWTFTTPEATLYIHHDKVGEHGAGPHWTWNDGSSITGKVTSTTPAADPTNNVASLDLSTTAVPGTSGVLTPVTRVTRTATQGGVAPATPCGARGTTLRVPYTATYTFFAQ